jgi:hypothetical protein
MVSRDYGMTWEDHKVGAQIDGHTLATHKHAPGRVYEAGAAGKAAGIWKTNEQGQDYVAFYEGGYSETHDGGITWEIQTEGMQHFYFYSLAVDPADPDVILLSGGQGPQHVHYPMMAASYLYRRTADTPWHIVSEGLPKPEGAMIRLLATHIAEPGIFYAASDQGVYHSVDQGIHWERLALDLPECFRWQHIRGFLVGNFNE